MEYVPHHLPVRRLDMAVQVWPAQTGDVALAVGAIVLQQQARVFENARILKVYAQSVIGSEELGG